MFSLIVYCCCIGVLCALNENKALHHDSCSRSAGCVGLPSHPELSELADVRTYMAATGSKWALNGMCTRYYGRTGTPLAAIHTKPAVSFGPGSC